MSDTVLHNQKAVNEIVQAYKDGVCVKKSRADSTADTTKVIEEQIGKAFTPRGI